MKRTLNNLAYAVLAVPMSAAGRYGLAARLGIDQPHRTRLGPLPVLAALPLVALVLFLTWTSWLYPLRPDAIAAIGHPFTADPIFDHAWGGSTLVGAWFVHAMAAFGMQVICMAMIRRLNGRHGRLPVEAV